MRRALILLAITALACRDRSAPKAAPPAPAAPARPIAAGSAAAAPARPELPAPGSGSALGSGTIADQFAADPVDVPWKASTEAELKRAYAKMKHPPVQTECRGHLCKLTIAGSQADLEAGIDELQVLHEQAQSLLLTAPVKGDGGQMQEVAYLQYER